MSFSPETTSWAVTHPYYSLTIAFVLWFAGLTTVQNARRNSKRLPYPPGPKGYPIIGSLLEAPTEKTWLTYAEWGRTYGEQLSYGIWSMRYFNTISYTSCRRHGVLQSAWPTIPHLEQSQKNQRPVRETVLQLFRSEERDYAD